MKSAYECAQHAARCEDLARASTDETNYRLLLVTASQWRKLGEKAVRAESGEITACKQPEVD